MLADFQTNLFDHFIPVLVILLKSATLTLQNAPLVQFEQPRLENFAFFDIDSLISLQHILDFLLKPFLCQCINLVIIGFEAHFNLLNRHSNLRLDNQSRYINSHQILHFRPQLFINLQNPLLQLLLHLLQLALRWTLIYNLIHLLECLPIQKLDTRLDQIEILVLQGRRTLV